MSATFLLAINSSIVFLPINLPYYTAGWAEPLHHHTTHISSSQVHTTHIQLDMCEFIQFMQFV